ncbi:MAG: DUF1343 domain-containing protein [Veillonellales bacterium]
MFKIVNRCILLLTIVLWLASGALPVHASAKMEPVKLGIDNIDSYLCLFQGKRVGLITNQTGVDSRLQSTVDILREKTNLVALFSPEHGIRGTAAAGSTVASGVDEQTGIKVYSLYGDTKKPTPEMLADVDILCFDIQDIGARSYTYMYTMAYAMESCREQHKTFVVFDRPNPVGGREVEGPVLKPGFESFIGLYPIPVRHGLTIGELALLFNKEFHIDCDLAVVKMTGWHRDMYWQDTGLPWVMTSPNIPTPDTALVFSGTGLFGDTNVSEGVGTTRPFELVGAFWLDPFELAKRMNDMHLPGVYFRPTYFTPRFGEHAGEVCGGVQLHVINRTAFKPVVTAVNLLVVIQELGGEHFVYSNPRSFDLAMGESELRENPAAAADQVSRWEQEAKEFKKLSADYLLYQ